MLTPHLLPAEFNKIATVTALGFVLVGFIGFFVKLIFIVGGQPLLLRAAGRTLDHRGRA
jgi:hypothetical protein